MSRTTAADRARRILAIVPWVAERDGPTLTEISERFGVSQSELLADLDVVFMVGTPPYTPDSLIDVVVEDGRVWITLGDYFRRPMRLVPSAAETVAMCWPTKLSNTRLTIGAGISAQVRNVSWPSSRSAPWKARHWSSRLEAPSASWLPR